MTAEITTATALDTTTATTPTGNEIAMPATTVPACIPPTTDRSPSTPRLDTSLSDPVAALAAGPVDDATTRADDTVPPASEERVTVGPEGPAPFAPRALAKRLPSELRREYAEEELNWLHSPAALDPSHAARRAVLMGWLERLEPVDRRVIALRYDRRVPSPRLADWLYLSTALVVAIDIGIDFLKDGVPDSILRTCAAELEELTQNGRTRHIDIVQRRAGRRFDAALEAFGRVRGHVALVVPTPREGPRTTTAPITAGEMSA